MGRRATYTGTTGATTGRWCELSYVRNGCGSGEATRRSQRPQIWSRHELSAKYRQHQYGRAGAGRVCTATHSAAHADNSASKRLEMSQQLRCSCTHSHECQHDVCTYVCIACSRKSRTKILTSVALSHVIPLIILCVLSCTYIYLPRQLLSIAVRIYSSRSSTV